MKIAQPVSALESAFLGLESRDVPFVFASILDFDREIPVDALREHVDRALADLPRYHHRVVRRLLRRPVWVEADFRIARHVRSVALPAPGGQRELEELTARLLSEGLPEGQPPWRVWTVSGRAGGRGAVIALFHHALVDGIAGFRLLEHVLGVAQAPAASPEPRRRGSLRKLISWRNARALVRLLREGLVPASQLGLNPRRTGRLRAVTSHTLPLAELAPLERAYAVTVNDIALAAVAGALRRFLLRRGLDPDAFRDVRVMVPVGRHAAGAHDTSGNKVVLLLVQLPLAEAGASERLVRVAAETRRLKHSHRAGAGDLLVGLAEATTPSLLTSVLHLALRLRAFQLLVTNIPGPRTQLSLLGVRLARIIPIVNLWPHQSLGIALASYAGTLSFGLQTDRAVISEPELLELRGDLIAELAELRGLLRPQRLQRVS